MYQVAADLYEERVTLWWSGSIELAIASAENEAREYSAILGDVEYLGFAQAYDTAIVADRVGQSMEVFSLLRTSSLEPEEYIDQFFDTGHERENRET